ncbi:DNA-binding MarR family transcriptional regulator [Variovorax boronicumulans]|uniref:hypothetical protein n=1 Tax=Variovorax boronicumulans TaxID=436515 RepID=UPI0027855002|nr:hypothetical protein [Variovorax boronicumulans]MDP9992000.1 DNA-binding MarR family transcriptional regulator [Variovorax boronicumulans]MDQ0001895.1 DNA-binding MarR family transcriptional regulator [Variovorax boronicumulans]
MNVGGQMLTILRAIAARGADAEEGACYVDIAEATGITQHLLMAKTSRLKARGLIERANPEVPRCGHAYFVVTAAGRAALAVPDQDEPEVPISSVQRAIQRRPQLATVWARA